MIMFKSLKIQWLPLVALLVLACVASLVPMPVSAQADQTCTATANANVRNGSSMAFPVIGTLQKGDNVTKLEVAPNGWVRHEKGWTSGSLLECGGSSTVTSASMYIASLMNNPLMTNYQASLPYDNPKPTAGIAGFLPVPSLYTGPFVFPNGTQVALPPAPADVRAWSCFPQDYSEGDVFNRGCSKLQAEGKLPWKTPVAGYNDGNNWQCEDTTGWCPDTISPFNWEVKTGFRICHPAVGCIQDPNGGFAMLVVVNFQDSVEVWNVRTNSAEFVDDGFEGYGTMFNLGSDNDVGTAIAHVRNHFIYNLGYPVGGDNRYMGQCGSSKLCRTGTIVTVARVWDRPEIGIPFSHFELLGAEQWVKP